jgi:DNA-binding GntR family transcriptional regulator
MILAEAARAPVGLSNAQNQSLRDHVHETLRLAIIAGRIVENERLTERQLAAELGVSTTPLKEAFRRLEAEGLIETLPRRGVRIRFGRAWAEEMILARAALESTIAAVAAERITQAQKAELAAVIERMRAGTDGDDVDRLVALNAQFHAGIHEASRCQHLTRLIERQQFYDADVRRIIHREVGERRTALEEHSAIAGAIVAGSAAEAERLMSHHVRRSGAHYLAFVFTEEGGRRIPAA